MARRKNRLPIGPANILTESEALAELGMNDDDARTWLRDRGLIHLVRGRKRVIAGDLADAIRSEQREGWPSRRRRVTPARRLPLSKSI